MVLKWCRPNLRKKYNLLENAWNAHFILAGRRKRMVEPDFSAWRPKHPEPLQSPVFHRGLSLLAGNPLLITQSHFSKTVTMRCAVSLQRICRGLIPSLSICKKGYRILGRGDAVGAGRKLPAHPRVLALAMPRRFSLFCRGLGTYIFTIATRHATPLQTPTAPSGISPRGFSRGDWRVFEL